MRSVVTFSRTVGPQNFIVHFMEDFDPFLNLHGKELDLVLSKITKVAQNISSPFVKIFRIESLYFNFLVYPINSAKDVKVVILSFRAFYETQSANPEVKKLLDEYNKVNLNQTLTEIEFLTKSYQLPDFESKEFEKLNEDLVTLSRNIQKETFLQKKNLFEILSDVGLNLTAQFSLIRIHILKFLAILPSLDHDFIGSEVKRVLIENLTRLVNDNEQFIIKKNEKEILPSYIIFLVKIILFFTKLTPAPWVAYFVRKSVSVMARRFIAGENINDSFSTISHLLETNRDATLDQLGELVVSNKEADHYTDKVLEIIHGLKYKFNVGEKNSAGINRAHVSIKVSALSPYFRPQAFDSTYESVAPRLKRILLAAMKNNVFINIDAEHYHFRDLVFEIYKKVLLETKELNQFDQTGIVIQAYLKDAYEHFIKIEKLAQQRRLVMPIRLVKGAYWDAETVETTAHSMPSFQFLNKEETDIHFKQLIYLILGSKHLQLAVASHNILDHAFSEVLRTRFFPQAKVIEHQCLHMTYEALSLTLAKLGYPTRNYMPIGNLLVGMGYLVRRIMENSSQVGILAQTRSKTLISFDQSSMSILKNKISNKTYSFEWGNKSSADFKNMSPVSFFNEDEADSYLSGLTSFKNKLPIKLKQPFALSNLVKITCPSDEKIEVGTIGFASIKDVKSAILNLKNTNRPEFSDKKFRVNALIKAALIMSLRRNELSYLIVFESGKSLIEANADVDEAIDFLNFYALMEKVSLDEYEAYGIMAVIAPWNFPLAIPCGMVSASLVCGNKVILKSAEQTPLIAESMIQIFYEAGFSISELIHLPGQGETVGESLVSHDDVKGIVFTGSKNIGTMIYQKSLSKLFKFDQHFGLRKVITEMGGKNAIIVSANAELDETISGVLYASFAHAGQKCSAASRILVHEMILDKFISRLKDAVSDLKIGHSFDPSITVNPLISIEEKNRLLKNIDTAIFEAQTSGGKIVVDRSKEVMPGSIIGPVVILGNKSLALDQSSFSCRELFGPVIHVIPFRDLNEAIEIFNATEYALTGGVYAQSQDEIDYLTSKMKAGNIYVNRPNTGARVGIEPFGGFLLSGTGPKAGSRPYIDAFKIKIPKKLEDRVFNSDFSLSGPHYKESPLIKKKISNQLRVNNVTIPGQLSFNDFQLSKKNLVVLSDFNKPNIHLINYLSEATALGVKVVIFVKNNENLTGWGEFIKGKVEWKNENISLHLINEDIMFKLFRNHDFEIYYLDSKPKEIEHYLSVIFSKGISKNYLPSILTNLEEPISENKEFYRRSLENVRSFAINTMRHGAPLELAE